MFDMVGAAMDLEGAVVVDLFAGTGALGIEALSRGAKHATFVETGRAALAAINANLAMLALGPERATVVIGDALRWATAADGVASADLVLADPPYAFDRWSDLLASLAGWAGLVVIESGTPIGLGDRWTRVRERRYGATVVTIAGPVPSGAAPAEPQVAP
jgi:16S rRNA (guanine966-N2)-methyltransferase